ncbi:MAG TPA: M20/M25/M40 family metallo-hydrolase [Vicinamibacteria bacterium]
MSHASSPFPAVAAILGLAALLLAGGAGAQTALDRPEAVRAHVEFLASDALNGRGSGTRDELIAATYAAAQFRQFGAEPAGDGGGYIQKVELVQRELAGPPALVVPPRSGPEARFVHGRDVIVAALAGPRVEAPLQKLGAAGAARVRPGAAAFLADPGPAGIAEAIERGAAIVLTVADAPTTARWESLAAPIPRLAAFLAAFGEAPTEGRPTVVILGADAARAVTALPEGSRLRVEGELKAMERGSTANVVARLPGSDPKRASEAVLLTAHIDHLGTGEPRDGDAIYNGANDDASGVAAVLELARALAGGPRPKRTVFFALFGSEEQGGYGAAYFRERPPIPLDRIVANIEFEEIGLPDPKMPPHTLWLTGWERSDLGPTLAAHGARLVADPHPEQDFFRRSDNYVLARRGVVAHTVSSNALYPQYHQPSDEPGILDYGHMAEAIASLIEPIRWLLDSDFRPRWMPGGKP